MDQGGSGGWGCSEKRRARARARYHANRAAENYRRTRMALRARIRANRALIIELENELAAQD